MEKEQEFIPYKFKSIKVYTSKDSLIRNKRKYRRVFEEKEVCYVYAELSFYNKLFDEKDWDANIELRAYQKGKKDPLSKMEFKKNISKSTNIYLLREGWGNPTPGQFWKRGSYYWEAYIDGEKIGSADFYIENGGLIANNENPYFELKSIKVYNSKDPSVKYGERLYLKQFEAKETQFIFAEITLSNSLDRDWVGEFMVNFINDSGQMKGQTQELKFIKKGQKEFYFETGWGSNSKGTWHPDRFSIELVFQDKRLAILPFEIGNVFEEGSHEMVTNVLDVNRQLASEPMPDLSLEEVMADLNELVGLEDIKKQIAEYADYIKFLQLRKEKGFDDIKNLSLHSMFFGPPGTGKTTVAKKLGKIMHHLGMLSKGHVHEVGRAELVAEFIGQTAPKVKKAIKAARGGILFIDEAYALFRSADDDKDFGREVIEILIKEMSDGPGDIMVIAAGYPAEMKTFINSNPGLKSRFSQTFEFPDYTPKELLAIAELVAQKRNVNLDNDAAIYLEKKLIDVYRERDRSFGNARLVTSWVDGAKVNMGIRIMKSKDPEDLPQEAYETISLADVEELFGKSQANKALIPIDQPLLNSALDELNDLIGLDQVKNEIQDLVKLVKFYRETGKDVLNKFSLHSVFVGNPGTGKTTVARILAKVFKGLGIIERGHIVEVDRSGLVAGYVGQTAIKTAEKIEEAIGGVLFVDEAYSLAGTSNQDFGSEAIETILKKMEDRRGEFIVIAAGYPDNMKFFLESNPGLKSRFDFTYHFADYKVSDLMEIAEEMFKVESIEMDDDARLTLKNYFIDIYEKRDKYFGNARSVRKIVDKSIRNQHLRLASIDAAERTTEMIKTLTVLDVAEFKADDESIFNQNQRKIGF